MNCPKCSSELLIDHVDENGKYFYTCINRQCPEYRKAFNPVSGNVVEASINRLEREKVEEEA